MTRPFPQVTVQNAGTKNNQIVGFNHRVDNSDVWQTITNTALGGGWYLQHNQDAVERFIKVEQSGTVQAAHAIFLIDGGMKLETKVRPEDGYPSARSWPSAATPGGFMDWSRLPTRTYFIVRAPTRARELRLSIPTTR